MPLGTAVLVTDPDSRRLPGGPARTEVVDTGLGVAPEPGAPRQQTHIENAGFTSELCHQARPYQIILELLALTSLDIHYSTALAREMKPWTRWLPKDAPWGTGRKGQTSTSVYF